MSGDGDNKSDKDAEDEEDGSRSEKSYNSMSVNKVNLHTKNAGVKGFGAELSKANKSGALKKSILTWPDKCIDRAVYVIFYPFLLLYWLLLPNIMHKPAIIKVVAAQQVLIGILFSFILFVFFAFFLTRLQEDLIFNFKIKPHLVAVFNSLMYTFS